MPQPRAFLSFDFDHDEAFKRMFAGQAVRASPTPFTVQDWSSKTSLPQAQWERLIEEKISRTHMVIVLVGRWAASAAGVVKEIQMAERWDVPFFGVYVDGAGTSTALPARLARNRVVPWTWPTIGAAIEQMMGEGKNV